MLRASRGAGADGADELGNAQGQQGLGQQVIAEKLSVERMINEYEEALDGK